MGPLKTVVALVAATVAASASIAGCSAHEPPPSFTDEQIDAYFEARVDAAWQNTGLAAIMERPPAPTPSARFREDNPFELTTCLGEKGITSWGMGESNGGPIYFTGSGEPASAEEQLMWFDCLQQNPQSSGFQQYLLTDDQKNYLYDYYKRWVIPCLISNDRVIEYVPTRIEYAEQWTSWVPYYSLQSHNATEAQVEESVRLCGEPLADLRDVPIVW